MVNARLPNTTTVDQIAGPAAPAQLKPDEPGLCGPGWPTQADAGPKRPKIASKPWRRRRATALRLPRRIKHQSHYEKAPMATASGRSVRSAADPTPALPGHFRLRRPAALNECRHQAVATRTGLQPATQKVLCARPFRADSIPGRSRCKLSRHRRRQHCNSARFR